MKLRYVFLTVIAIATVGLPASAHGPQIQITNDDGKIVAREVVIEEPYSNLLTPQKSVYVMPVLPLGSVWYSRPNTAIDPILNQPAYPSGPGFAYGYDMADGGPQAFQAGSLLSLGFTDGLKLWNGVAFADAGATQLKAFRGSNAEITTPDPNFAVTSDIGPFDNLSLPAVAADYSSEVHNSLRFALLGDGTSSTSSSPDGVYLLSMQVSSTQSGLAPSDPYYFVLNKNAPWSTVADAVNSLGIGPLEQQWLVPEPGACVLAFAAIAGMFGFPAFARKRRKG